MTRTSTENFRRIPNLQNNEKHNKIFVSTLFYVVSLHLKKYLKKKIYIDIKLVNIFVLASKKYINLEHSTFLAMKNSKHNIKIVNRNFEITLKHHM